MIKNENMCDLDGYKKLIQKGDPDFIELKSYVWVGASQDNYKVENMPFIEDLRDFANKLIEKLPEY